MNSRLQKMIDERKIPNRGGVFIDAYNQSINENIAMTITTRVCTANHYYITEEMEKDIVEPKIRQVGRGFNKGGDHNICPTVTSNSFECNNFVVGSMQKNAYKGTVDGVSPAITAACGMGGGQTPMVGNSYRIRNNTKRMFPLARSR